MVGLSPVALNTRIKIDTSETNNNWVREQQQIHPYTHMHMHYYGCVCLSTHVIHVCTPIHTYHNGGGGEKEGSVRCWILDIANTNM